MNSWGHQGPLRDAELGHPSSYQYKSLLQEELVPIYSASGVMLITPLRDGMNLGGQARSDPIL
jgi:trehalose-6-phosphate synthase